MEREEVWVEPVTITVWLISCAKWSVERQIHEIQKGNNERVRNIQRDEVKTKKRVSKTGKD